MSQWVRNEDKTRLLRAEFAGAMGITDGCVYDKGHLTAFVMYADIADRMPGLRWHILLASSDGMPDMSEIHEVRQTLLPGIDEFAILPAPECGENCLEICELIEQPERGVVRWARRKLS